jgi:phosphoribosylformylglycinamidine synthase II
VPVTQPQHRLLGMTDGEYDAVVGVLGREPTDAELMTYSLMWSEHCSYKTSRPHLGVLPTESARVVVGPGTGAGVVDIGDGMLAALRIESHNHPSFVEPYQGAATGVGGILRDILSMGARPIALWNQIRFGSLDNAHNRYLFGGVVGGIAGYGNAVGVPTLGGEIAFEECFDANPLINVMCLGTLRAEDLVLGYDVEPGTIAVLLGAPSGRDGIGGASTLASASFSGDDQEKRPSVQVGDPFAAKKMIEACLELCERKLLVGLQDLGAAGVSCATSESAARAGRGIDIDLDAMPRREEGMTPPELLVSESQERMLALVDPKDLPAVLEVAERWETQAAVIGTITPGDTMRVFENGGVVAEMPAASLADGSPLYQRPAVKPDYVDELWEADAQPAPPEDAGSALLDLLDLPALGDRSWVYEQYDHMLFLNTVVPPGNDGALLRVRGTRKGLAVSSDGDSRRCYLDPRRGAGRLVYESALNVAVTGAEPVALVDNLNFGDPEHPEVMWQFIETLAGVAEACEALGVPVIGGNVSFYNSTAGGHIQPTPVIGMLGLANPMPDQPPRLDAGREGMELWLFGGDDSPDFAGSAFAEVAGAPLTGRPLSPDPQTGRAVVEAARLIASGGDAAVVHDVSEGGLAVAVAEICIRSGVGARLDIDDWKVLFGEAPHRFVAAFGSVPPDVGAIIGARRLGVLGGETIELGSMGSVPLDEAADVWRDAIRRRMRSA